MILEKPSNSMLDEWRKGLSFKRFTKNYLGRLRNNCNKTLEESFYKQDLIISYASARELFRDSYEELFAYVFDEYFRQHPAVGCELGPGNYPSMLMLMPHTFKEWFMLEISNGYLWMAKRRTPKDLATVATYCNGTYHNIPLRDCSCDVVAGMNSIETTADTENVINEARRVMKDCGKLIVIQDVIPTSTSQLIRQYAKQKSDITTFVNRNKMPLIFQTPYGMKDIRSLHVDDVREVCEAQGLRTLFCGIIESSGTYDIQNSRPEIADMRKGYKEIRGKPLPNDIKFTTSNIRCEFNPDLPDGRVMQKIAVNVLIAEK